MRPTTKPRARNFRRRSRLALFIAASLAFHALLFLLSRLAERPPAPPPVRESIRITLVEPGGATRPGPPPGAPRAEPLQRPSRRPLRRPLAGLLRPHSPSASKQAPQTNAPRDLSQVKLFDPHVVGRAIARADAAEIAPHAPAEAAEDLNSPLLEKARVNARVGQQLREAAAEGDVMAGLRASCDDGLDQGYDGFIDCADPMCRQLPLCDGTGEYADNRPEEIPDGAGEVVHTLRTSQPGRLRKLAVIVDIEHASPGDLSIVLVSPSGTRAELRHPDRSEGTYFRAFYVADFNGEPAAGEWKVVIQDRFAGGTGRLKKWILYATS